MFRMISIIAFAGTVAAIVLYHRIIRARHIVHEKEPREVYRFSLGERFFHAAAVLSLLTLAVTGFLAVCLGGPLRGWLWVIHVTAAPVFSVAVCIVAMVWAEDCRLERGDWRWVVHLGGYLWRKDDLPAGRFNAGQKGFFWFVAAMALVVILSGVGRMYPILGEPYQEILYQVHRYAALAVVLGIIAHFYLGTFANPGTFWAMVTGYVGPKWAKHHHPLWWDGAADGQGAR